MSKLVRITGSISPNSPDMKVREFEIVKAENGALHAKEHPSHASASYRVEIEKLGALCSNSSPGWFHYFVWLQDPSEEDIASTKFSILIKLSENVTRHVESGKKFEADLLQLLSEFSKEVEGEVKPSGE